MSILEHRVANSVIRNAEANEPSSKASKDSLAELKGSAIRREARTEDRGGVRREHPASDCRDYSVLASFPLGGTMHLASAR